MISNYIEEDFVRQTRGQPAKSDSNNALYKHCVANGDNTRRVASCVASRIASCVTRRISRRDARRDGRRCDATGDGRKNFRGKKVLDGEDTTRRATARRDARRDASPMYKSNGKEATSRRYGTTSCRRVVWWRRLRPTRRCVS